MSLLERLSGKRKVDTLQLAQQQEALTRLRAGEEETIATLRSFATLQIINGVFFEEELHYHILQLINTHAGHYLGNYAGFVKKGDIFAKEYPHGTLCLIRSMGESPELFARQAELRFQHLKKTPMGLPVFHKLFLERLNYGPGRYKFSLEALTNEEIREKTAIIWEAFNPPLSFEETLTHLQRTA